MPLKDDVKAYTLNAGLILALSPKSSCIEAFVFILSKPPFASSRFLRGCGFNPVILLPLIIESGYDSMQSEISIEISFGLVLFKILLKNLSIVELFPKFRLMPFKKLSTPVLPFPKGIISESLINLISELSDL